MEDIEGSGGSGGIEGIGQEETLLRFLLIDS